VVVAFALAAPAVDALSVVTAATSALSLHPARPATMTNVMADKTAFIGLRMFGSPLGKFGAFLLMKVR
jgi:hypothetical protein